MTEFRVTNEAVTNDPNSKNGAVKYGLDPVGNRLAQSATLPGVPSGTFTFDANDRLAGETYNNNGNTLSSGGKLFKYDFENRRKTRGVIWNIDELSTSVIRRPHQELTTLSKQIDHAQKGLDIYRSGTRDGNQEDATRKSRLERTDCRS